MSFELSNRTKEILANFTGVNKSLQFRKGNVLRTLSESRDVFAVAAVAENFPVEFAIYDLSRFLGIVSLFKAADMAFQDKWVTISEANRKVNYVYTSPNMIVGAPDRDMGLPEKIAEFDIPASSLGETLKALSLMGLSEVVLSSDGSTVELRAVEVKNPTGNSYVNRLSSSVSAPFEVVMSGEKLMRLIKGDYHVTVTNGELKGQIVSIIKFETIDVSYFICPEESSTFG